jgi:ActR/RegA family two-component response regulator
MKITIEINDNKLLTLKEVSNLVKKKYVKKVLENNNGNISATARALGYTQRHAIYRVIDPNYKH